MRWRRCELADRNSGGTLMRAKRRFLDQRWAWWMCHRSFLGLLTNLLARYVMLCRDVCVCGWVGGFVIVFVYVFVFVSASVYVC